MQIFDSFNTNKNLSLAFGFFDGVHLGHQAVVRSAVNFARDTSTKSAIITFQDHPCCFFYKVQPKYIIKREEKFKFFEELGVDYVYSIKFDEYLSMMSASEYLQEIIMKNFQPVAISTGFNHYFGAGKTGNVGFLCDMQKEFCYRYFEVAPKKYNDEIISSTAIREALAQGNINKVNGMLGYNYFLKETVVQGEQLGRQIGFKTANLIYPNNLVEIGKGVYKVQVQHGLEIFDGIANFGARPTVSKDKKLILEVHILNFDKDIYGEKIKVTFLKKLREEKKFSSINELQTQIQKDINDSKK